MKSNLSRFSLLTSKINRQQVMQVLTIISLALLVLGIGAPEAAGGGGI